MITLRSKLDILRAVEVEGKHKKFTYRGVRCEINRHSTMSHLCGYLHLEDVSEDDREIMDNYFHFGVTYEHEGKYGFDCAHLGDILPYEKLTYDDQLFGEYSTYKTMAFVENCLKCTVDALIDGMERDSDE